MFLDASSDADSFETEFLRFSAFHRIYAWYTSDLIWFDVVFRGPWFDLIWRRFQRSVIWFDLSKINILPQITSNHEFYRIIEFRLFFSPSRRWFRRFFDFIDFETLIRIAHISRYSRPQALIPSKLNSWDSQLFKMVLFVKFGPQQVEIRPIWNSVIFKISMKFVEFYSPKAFFRRRRISPKA